MVPESRTTLVQILGHDYRLRSDESPEFVQEVAAYVEAKVREVSSAMAAGTPVQVVSLAALNIAEEFLRFRREANGSAGAAAQLEQRLAAVLRRLDEIAPGTGRTAAPGEVPAAATVRAGAGG